MAKVLQNFLIGVGLDTEKYDEGAKRVESSLARMRPAVGITGAAISGAFGLAGTAAINAGKRIHDFNTAADKLKTPTAYVHDYGRALAALGGNAEDAITSIGSLEARLAEMRAGGTGRFAGDTDLALAGVDIWPLREAQTGEEFLRELAKQVPNLNQEQQLRVQETLGLSDVVMISLKGGVEAFDAGIARAGDLYGEFGRATDAAKEYIATLAEVNTRLEGIGEEMAQKILPSFSGLLRSFGSFIDEHRGTISGAIDIAADNPAATALITGSGAAAAAGAGLRAVGLRTAGQSLMRAGPYGVAAGAAMMAWDIKPDDIEKLTGYRPNDYIFNNTPLDALRDGYSYLSDKLGDKAEAIKNWQLGDWWERSKNSIQGSWRDWVGQNDQPHTPDMQLPLEVGDGVSRPASEAMAAPDAPEPVYFGGEVNNKEAASISPDVLMIREQREQSVKPAAPARINLQNHLDVHMEIDGRSIDSRVVDVVERRERAAMDDIYSSVDR